MIQEGSKIKLVTGEIALVSEVLQSGAAYVAEVFKQGGGVSVDPICQDDIESVFVETEHLLRAAI